jgi:hypothetical protein
MTCRPAALVSAALAICAAFAVPAQAAAQQQGSRVETVQIGEQIERRYDAAAKAYLEPAPPAQPAPPSESRTASEQIPSRESTGETAQISADDQGGSAVMQLSQAELEATLAQLTAAERRVLLEAIEGTDICDNPPDVAAIRTLCRDRIETRSAEFADRAKQSLSAEERLLRGGVDEGGTPNVERVIERLARASAAPDNFDNQAIASIALAPPPAPPTPDEETEALGNLPPGTEAVINAIINQMGGGAGGP